MRNLLTISLANLVLLTNSFAFDVLPKVEKRGARYVRVTSENSRIKFESCKLGLEKTTCKTLGKKRWYHIEELKEQRFEENADIALSAGADAGAVFLIFASGGLALSGLSLSGGAVGAAAASVGDIAIMGGSVVATGGLVTAWDAMNPYEQYQQAQTLRTDVIADNKVTTANMEDFIARLDLVLSDID